MKLIIDIITFKQIKFVFISLIFFATTVASNAQSVKMRGKPSSIISTFAIVPEGKTLTFTSGLTASALDSSLEDGDYAKYGDTKTQALSILDKFKILLSEEGLDLGQAFSMKVYVSKDPLKGIFDFKGWNEAYKIYFGTTENPNKPVRATVGIAELVNPNKFIEIELILAN
ncbi:MAG: enamine deaminase RidA (YjgF/YER057c/UK114 family) [Arcticibacterium sp.]|jgi:enamine deaminase RidA (YjgF/YER057c/UK114 family)